MATNYTSQKIGYYVAEQFNESFFEPEPTTTGYIFLANHVPYSDENTPDEIYETPFNEKEIWKNIFAMKKVRTADVSLVIPKNEWNYGVEYQQYDDDASNLQINRNHYVSVGREVFLCLSNNQGGISTAIPELNFGDYTADEGIVATEDGYVWRYLYTVPESSKFNSLDYIPVPSKTNVAGFNMSAGNLVDGAIHSIKILNSGNNYTRPTIASVNYTSSTNRIQMATITGIANNMSVSGRGILANTFVSNIDVVGSTVILSKNTNPRVTTLPTTNRLTFTPRVIIQGDGSGAVANVRIEAGRIVDANVLSYGSGYSRANVIIYGNGTQANLKAVIGPKYGHGFNPARELGANAVMIAVKIGDLDSTEGGLIPDHVKFRQYGLLVNPYKYSNTKQQLYLSANNVAVQTYDLTLTTGGNYIRDELVYQGDAYSNASFSGYVCTNTSTIVSLTKVNGTLRVGSALKGNTSGVTRYVIGVDYPEYEPFTGDILYVQNITPVQRATNQAETLRLVLTF